jgi:hypothetical protein
VPIDGLRPVAPQRTPSTKPAPTPIKAADCARIKALLASVTAGDVEAAREPAKVDTAACGLRVECGAPPARAIDVERQTTTGSGHVVELIRAVYGER